MQNQEPYKRKSTSKMDVDFLVSPIISCENYTSIPFDEKSPRAIPFPDGPFGDNPFINIHDNGKKITFDMQEGSTMEGYNGTYADAIILFARALIEAKNQGPMFNRYNSMAITSLEQANWALFARAAERHARGVQGTNKQ
jgi:hypothetical protein